MRCLYNRGKLMTKVCLQNLRVRFFTITLILRPYVQFPCLFNNSAFTNSEEKIGILCYTTTKMEQ